MYNINLNNQILIIDIKNFFLILLSILYFSLGFVIYIRNKKDRLNLLFFLTLVTVTLWTISMILYRGFANHNLSVLLARILYFSASFIPLSFIYFNLLLFHSEKYKISFKDLLIWVFWVYIAFISIFPNYLIKNVIIVPNQEKIIIFNQKLHLIYAIYIILYFYIAFMFLFKKVLLSIGLTRLQLIYFSIGTLTSAILGVLSNLLLPLFGIFTFNWFGQFGVIGLVISVSYAMIKYNLFNIKVILTEIFVFIICILFLGKVIVSINQQDFIINLIIFIFTITFGMLLIKSVRLEVEQREKLEQLNRIKSEFLSFTSHQVKAPMAVVKGYAELIAESIENVPEQAKDFAKKIKDSVNNLLELVEEFMDYRRIEEGKMELHFEEVDIVSLIKEIINNFQLIAKEKNLELTFETQIEQFIIKADKTRITQVIQNLIDNAIKYTPQGWVRVTLSKDNDNILITVADSGIGISKELQSKLFGEFVRDPSIKKEIRGTGLGLYIAKNIVEAHQGQIWAESEGEGKGSKFFIRLPLNI